MRRFIPLAALALLGCLPQDDPRKAELTTLPLMLSDTPAQVNTNHRPLCRNYPAHVFCVGAEGRAPELHELQRIDMRLRLEFQRDESKAGEWAPGTRGVCLTYALELAERLAAAGYGGTSMTLMASQFNGVGHATLVVRTADGQLYEVGDGRSERPRLYAPERMTRVAWATLDGRRDWRRGRNAPAPELVKVATR